MCGILGAINSNQVDRRFFRDFLKLSKKRGPDSTGYWEDNLVQFGFNRLAILDVTSAGNQPMLSPSGRFVMVFNGEIYNHKSLIRRYGIIPTSLRSSSDAEVIVQLLDILPVNRIIGELNGMFAIAIYDRQDKRIWLTRDFAGIKPLYYGIKAENIVFASQFNQVFSFSAFKRELSLRPEIVKEYLALGYMHAPNTVYKDIFQCLPGELVSFDAEGTVDKERIKMFPANSITDCSETDLRAVDSLHDILKGVVKDQLASDVPLSCFLSGGIDSPLICAVASKLTSGLRAFTVGTHDQDSNEAEVAHAYAQHLSVVQSVFYYSEEELVKTMDEHFDCFSEPFGDYSSLPTFLITKKARELTTVMLSGDGGDELFWGYPRFLSVVDHYPWFSYPKPIRGLAASMARISGMKVSYAIGSIDDLGLWVLHKQEHNKKRIVDKVLPGYSYSEQLMELYTIPEGITNKQDLLQWLRWNEFYGHLQRVLVKVDRASMGNSIEIRVPLLDRRIIEFSGTIKPLLGITHNDPKWMLKRTMERYFPKEIIYQPKRGFGVPIDSWMKSTIKEEVRDLLLGTPFYGKELINEDYLRHYVNEYYDGKHESYWGIWILFAWQKWAKKQCFI